jgi:hypothetical protein
MLAAKGGKMSTFARFTATIFIVVAVLVIMGGFTLLAANSGDVRTSDGSPPSILDPFRLGFRLGGVVLLIWGLPILALGQGLWLMANIADEAAAVRKRTDLLRDDSEQTRDFLATLVHRINPPKPKE